jgi:hypothetical protein
MQYASGYEILGSSLLLLTYVVASGPIPHDKVVSACACCRHHSDIGRGGRSGRSVCSGECELRTVVRLSGAVVELLGNMRGPTECRQSRGTSPPVKAA